MAAARSTLGRRRARWALRGRRVAENFPAEVGTTVPGRRAENSRLPFREKITRDRGTVLQANRRFQKGEIIFREKPLLSQPADDLEGILKSFMEMGAKQRAATLSLHCPDSATGRGFGGAELQEVLGGHGEGVGSLLAELGWNEQAAEEHREEVWQFLRIINANALMWAEDEVMSVCQHVSRLNHSCEPNMFLFDALKSRGEIWWLAARDVEWGEELCYSYMDDLDGTGPIPMLPSLLLPVGRRRRKLREDWGFSCMCDRCRRESDEDGTRTFRCPSCESPKVMVSRSAAAVPEESATTILRKVGLSVCSNCLHVPSAEDAERLLQAEKQATKLLQLNLKPAAVFAVKRGENVQRNRLALFAEQLSESGLAQTHWLFQWLECLAGWGPPMNQLTRPAWRSLAPHLRDYFEIAGRAETGSLPAVRGVRVDEGVPVEKDGGAPAGPPRRRMPDAPPGAAPHDLELEAAGSMPPPSPRATSQVPEIECPRARDAREPQRMGEPAAPSVPRAPRRIPEIEGPRAGGAREPQRMGEPSATPTAADLGMEEEGESTGATIEGSVEEAEASVRLTADDLKNVLRDLKAFFKEHRDTLGDEGVRYLGESFKTFAREPGRVEEFMKLLPELPTPEVQEEFEFLLERVEAAATLKAAGR